jgi:uncharacterized protein involved in exopolysaccharide biosynthesis
MGNGMIWTTTLLYLKVTKPTYTSELAMVLPGSNFGVNVNLPGIGQATSSSSSGGGNASYDPRANYDFIFTSEPVLSRAAELANVPEEKFGKPKIKLVDNTTMMLITITGPSPKETQKRLKSLYQAIFERLQSLRYAEIQQRQGPTQNILRAAQQRLEQAQVRLSAYKQQSGLVSPQQVESLLSNLEQLRQQRSQINAQKNQLDRRLQQLVNNLGLTPQMAADAFKLQSDQLFQQNLKDYSEATAALDILQSKFGPNHPQVVKEFKRQQAAQAGMNGRGQVLLGKPLTAEMLSRIMLSPQSAGRDALFQNLVTTQSEFRGVEGQVKALDQEIYRSEIRLRRLTQRQSTLENLMRDVQVAEAVFTSTLAKLDLGQGDIFSAYPLVQLALEPTLPDKPSAPQKGIILAGAVVGSLFSTAGLWILWIRKPWIKRLAHWIST